MTAAPNTARVCSVEWAQPAPAGRIVLGDRTIEVRQDHLLAPFVSVLQSIERLAEVAADGHAASSDEACVAGAYSSLYEFFHALLPSAGHEVLDGLTYSVALLLVGEAIEVSRVVAPAPSPTAAAAAPKPAGGASASSPMRQASSFPSRRPQ